MIRFKDAGEPRGTNGKSFVEINDRDSFEYIIRLIHSIIFLLFGGRYLGIWENVVIDFVGVFLKTYEVIDLKIYGPEGMTKRQQVVLMNASCERVY